MESVQDIDFKRILLLFDSFKGSLSARDITIYLTKKIYESFPQTTVTGIPLADGGEGTLDALKHLPGFTEVKTTVFDPFFRKVEASYLVSENNTAYIELAAAAGLTLLQASELNCMRTTTLGVGEMLRHASVKGCTECVLFVGGSATNDGGMGIAHALGYRFYNKNKSVLQPTGENLVHITSFGKPKEHIKFAKIRLATDVKNTLYGSHGAAYMYAAQKGASTAQIKVLDQGLQNLAYIIEKQTGIATGQTEGFGAAGGVGAMLAAMGNVQVVSGASVVFELLGVEAKITKSTLVFTGEGKTDSQTLSGKLVQQVAALCAKHGKPTWAVCGYFDGNEILQKQLGLSRVFSLTKHKEQASDSIQNPYRYLDATFQQIKNELTPYRPLS